MIEGKDAMPVTYRYALMPEFKLIVYSDDGIVTPASLESSKEIIKDDPRFDPEMVMLLDFSNGSIQMTPAEMNLHVDFIEHHAQWSKIRRFAIVTSTPEQVAKALLYKKKAREAGGKYQAFSSIEAAIQWLHIPLRLQEKAIVKVKGFLNSSE